ncbi:MAG: hypothetical protein N7Q72_06330, partial [Spiroplasma sp. Tabriz.8]|nr:hypothetical protein [Spiroplasma sp. Tabriz.8]
YFLDYRNPVNHEVQKFYFSSILGTCIDVVEQFHLDIKKKIYIYIYIYILLLFGSCMYVSIII